MFPPAGQSSRRRKKVRLPLEEEAARVVRTCTCSYPYFRSYETPV